MQSDDDPTPQRRSVGSRLGWARDGLAVRGISAEVALSSARAGAFFRSAARAVSGSVMQRARTTALSNMECPMIVVTGAGME
jgi:hypothetical protein